MSETKREGHIRRITNALIADEAKVGIHFTHDAVVELLELLKVQPDDSCDGCRYENADDGVMVMCGFCKRSHLDCYERRTDGQTVSE